MRKLSLFAVQRAQRGAQNLRTLIAESRRQALRAVNAIQVRTCWEVGRHIVEYEQGGAARAEYEAGLLKRLADALTSEFGRGFDERNRRNMRGFHQAFPKWNALRSELRWTHYRLLLRVEEPDARVWYMIEAAGQGWNTLQRPLFPSAFAPLPPRQARGLEPVETASPLR